MRIGKQILEPLGLAKLSLLTDFFWGEQMLIVGIFGHCLKQGCLIWLLTLDALKFTENVVSLAYRDRIIICGNARLFN